MYGVLRALPWTLEGKAQKMAIGQKRFESRSSHVVLARKLREGEDMEAHMAR